MRILIVTGIFPPDVGGPASYVPRIADALSRKGHEVTVVTLSASASDASDAQAAYRIVRIVRGSGPLQRLSAVLRVLAREQRSADVVYVNGLQMESALAGLIRRRPVVMKVVGDFAWERTVQNRGWSSSSFEEFQWAKQPVRVDLLRRMRTWWTQRADRVIVASEYFASVVEAWGVRRADLRVVYNSVHLPEAGSRPSSASTSSASALRVIMPCRLVPFKQVDWMIEAVAGLPYASLQVIGAGPEEPRLRALIARLGVEARIRIDPAVPQSEVWERMRAADVLGLISTWESFSHVAVEGRALGLLVVATRIPGIQEALAGSKNVIYVDEAVGSRVEALQDALHRAAERLASGHPKAERDPRFSFDAMADATEAVLVEASSAFERSARS